MGTAQYMSPEQARESAVDMRTNIWSLSVVLYEMLIGRVPFEGETPSHMIVSIPGKDPPPLPPHSEVPVEPGVIDFNSDQIFWFEWSSDGSQLGVSRGGVTSDIVLIKDLR